MANPTVRWIGGQQSSTHKHKGWFWVTTLTLHTLQNPQNPTYTTTLRLSHRWWGLKKEQADRSRLGGMGFRYHPAQDGRAECQPAHTTQLDPTHCSRDHHERVLGEN